MVHPHSRPSAILQTHQQQQAHTSSIQSQSINYFTHGTTNHSNHETGNEPQQQQQNQHQHQHHQQHQHHHQQQQQHQQQQELHQQHMQQLQQQHHRSNTVIHQTPAYRYAEHGQHHPQASSHHNHNPSVPTLHRPIHPPPPPPPILLGAKEGHANQTCFDVPSNVASHARLGLPGITVTGPSVTGHRLQTSEPSTQYNSQHLRNHLHDIGSHYGHPSNLLNHRQLLYQQQRNPQTNNQHGFSASDHGSNDRLVSDQHNLLQAPLSHSSAYNIKPDCVDSGHMSQDQYTEQVIQAILAAKDSLEKPIEERDERDILYIDNLCALVHGFDSFPKTVRRALAAQAVLIVIDEEGKELIVHNEELDSFCVLIFGECEQLNASKTVPIRSYHVGDAFGVLEPTHETIRFVGHMITKCENCAFLCVKRDDFFTILTDVANYPNQDTIRHRDSDGNIVCVSQFDSNKKSSGPLWAHHMQSTNPMNIVLPDGHIITKATEAYLLLALVDGYDRIDPDYMEDFLLLFRVYMTYDIKDKEKKLPPGMIKLCLTLARWLDQVNYRDRVVKIVLTWMSSYYHDFELNPDFSYLFFRVLESRLLNLSMNNQLHLLHVTLSAKSKIRHVTITRSSREQPLPFAIAGGYEKNCGIFVTQAGGVSCDDNPFDKIMNYLKYSNYMECYSARNPLVAPRLRQGAGSIDQKVFVSLRPGDQILEVNGTNFVAIKLAEAHRKLDMCTHLSITVKYNPSAFHEMRALPEGRRKSSLSSMASVSPFPSSNSQSRFNFNPGDVGVCGSQNDIYPLASPLFSSNANFGFKSIIKSVPKGDKSRLSSLINSSKQLVKQIRDSTVPTSSSNNNIDTVSKASDNISDDQSNDIDIGKSKSSPDLAGTKSKDKQIETGLSNMIHSGEFNPTAIIDGQTNSNGQAVVNVLRVFNAANNESRYLLVHEETTAREVVMVAVKEFNLTASSPMTTGASQTSPGEKSISSLNWHLYEVSVVPESKTIKQKCLSEQISRLAERASLCSRFYIKSNLQSSFGPTRIDMGDDALVNEILKESPAHVNLASLNATLLAVELTLTDFDKFKSIEPQQFVYDTFFDYSEKNSHANGSSTGGADSASLKSSSSDGQDNGDSLHSMNKARAIPKKWVQEYTEFADISNREMFWVVCEILNERNISRRVKIIKQFVRVADVCSQLRNYNSMFAIISGLGHSCVNRLRRTFDKLKPKYKNQLEKMRSLFDPSKNMSNYRMCLHQTPPPAIPLFPQIKKDLTFTKEGRSIFVRETNDQSDDEDFSNSFSQCTIKRKSNNTNNDSLTVRSNLIPNATKTNNNISSSVSVSHLDTKLADGFNTVRPSRSISYVGFNNRLSTHTDADSILVNFAEIRQFTDRVRNVIYFSSVPYSNDLLTNTKDSQRNQAQIKKMHEEWQMRKRIRHYINLTLNNEQTNAKTAATSSSVIKPRVGNDQLDSGVDSSTNKQVNGSQRLSITYDERTLYQRSLEVEADFNARVTAPSQHSQQTERHQNVYTSSNNNNNTHSEGSTTVSDPSASSNMQMQPPPPPLPPLPQPPSMSAASSSPTLSKSSSLSSCASFNQQQHFHAHNNIVLPGYHNQRSANLSSSVGKFGTESTESLRKLQALSEKTSSSWRPYNGNAPNGNGNPHNTATIDLGTRPALDHSRLSGLVTSRIFPSKNGR